MHSVKTHAHELKNGKEARRKFICQCLLVRRVVCLQQNPPTINGVLEECVYNVASAVPRCLVSCEHARV